MATEQLTDSLRETLSLFDESGTPRTTSEVADLIDLGRRSTYDRLDRLVERDRLETKKVGASARVWWRPASGDGVSEYDGRQVLRLVDNVPGIVYRCLDEPGWPMSFVSEAALDITGYEPAAIEADEVSWGGDVIHPEDRELVREGVDAQLAEDSRFSLEYRIRTADGETRWVREWGCVVEDPDAPGTVLEGVISDVTEEVRSKRALAQRERQFGSLVEATEEYAIFMLDDEGRIRTWNRGAERIKGYDHDEILGEHFSTFYTPEDRDAGVPAENLAAAVAEGSTEDEGWRVRADGSRFWARVTITAVHDDGELVGYVKVTRDMTERREYERRIREEKGFVESLLDHQRDLIYALDVDGEPIRWNDHFRQVTGYEEADLDEMHFEELIAEDGTGEARDAFERVLEGGESVTSELPLETADGDRIPYEFSATPLTDEDGTVVGLTGIGRDISARKATERRLERQRDDLEAELDEVFARIDDAFYGLDEQYRFTYVNGRAEELLDHSEAELLGRNVWEVFPDANETPVRELFRDAMENQEPTEYEVYFEPLEFWVEGKVYPSENGLSVYFRDVTERKERERELERYETIVEAVGDAVFVVDDDQRFTMVNPAAEEMSGYGREDIVGRAVGEFIGEESAAEALELGRGLATGDDRVASAEFDLRTADGGETPIEVRFTRIPSGAGGYESVGVARDVSERKERERELEQYETIVETVDDGVYVLDEDFHFVEVNDAYVEMTGYDREELLGTHCTLVVDDDVSAESARRLEEIMAGGATGATLEADIHRKDGSTLRAESRFSALTPEDDDGHRKVGVVRDVSERARRERELEQYETIVETVDDGIYAVDPDGRFTMVNEAYVEMTGYSREELLGMHVSRIVDGETVDAAADLEADLRSGERDTARLEADVITADGERIPAEATFALGVADDDYQRIGVVRDVSERRRRERELRRRIHQQEVVTELGQRALEVHDVDALMADAAELVAETLDNDYCKVLDLDQDADRLLLRRGVGWDDGVVGSATVSAVDDDSQAAYTLKNDRPVVVTDLETDSRFGGPELLANHDVRSGISAIIGSPDDPWGILGTHDTAPGEFSDHDVNFVRSVATIIATAIHRHDHERELLRQRQYLAALDDINRVVRDLTEAVIDKSTREEIERVVCEGLANSDSYEFAWIGEEDGRTRTVTPRVEVGTGGYLDHVTISTDPDDERSRGPTGRAVLEGEVQTVQDVGVASAHDPWRDEVEGYGFRSTAAIPIAHDDVVYGVLNVYAQRRDAFSGDERDVVAHLGEVVGHAIASVERKRALTSDEVVELAFRLPDLFDAIDLPPDIDVEGQIVLERSVPVDDGVYLVYGTAEEGSIRLVEALVENLPHWESVTSLGEDRIDGRVRFEGRLVDPPVLSTVTAHGGYVDEARIEDGDYAMRIHLPPSTDVRAVIDSIQDAYPAARLVTRQQVSREDDVSHRVAQALGEDLTDRQRTALEAAYFGGYFEWPRDASGEDVAASMGVAPPTFHQHLRKAQRTLLGVVLDDSTPA